jgi:hypothetical protein
LHRNCLLKHVIDGKVEGKRRCKQLQDDRKEKNNIMDLKDKALDHTLRRTGCGRGNGIVARKVMR